MGKKWQCILFRLKTGSVMSGSIKNEYSPCFGCFDRKINIWMSLIIGYTDVYSIPLNSYIMSYT